MNSGESLLSGVRSDLEAVMSVCKGEQKQDNHLRSVISALNKGQVPTGWLRYTTPKAITSVEWMSDFSERVKQLSALTNSKNLREEEIWIGGLFSPEAYITATRQLIAQTNGWSLEQLHLHLSTGGKKDSDLKFTINGTDLDRFRLGVFSLTSSFQAFD